MADSIKVVTKSEIIKPMKNYKQILENAKGMIEATKKSTGKLKDACWKGFTAVGTKTKGGRTVPNCVPIKDSVEIDEVKFKPMPGTLNYGVNGDDPSRYMGAAKPLMQRKTDARGNLIKKPKRDMSGMSANDAVKMAKDLIKTLTQKAPNNTSIEVIGSSGGKTYSFYIRRGKISGQDVWVAAKSGNTVELNAAGTGLQVVDAKSRRIMLDRGTDVYWN